ncbi:hypothetical protein [Hirschia baltica]|uniref:Uncharacterized protein n=1 Tax=Hirschia baltica (strain ATCC 49814 / DSM 5838 / IFAM 1418) TaxID=582402 RepID=C6XR21_HIRBI|nr:hypothetical protein [Hirschia baltica]ACT60552.1 hypothetical protein Hbal_2880 [Hirschia baltica ATCC 49814]
MIDKNKQDGVINFDPKLIISTLGILCFQLHNHAMKHYELRAKKPTATVIREKRIMTHDAIIDIINFLHTVEGTSNGHLHRSLIPILDALTELIETGNAADLLVGEVYNRPPDRLTKIQLKVYCVIVYNVLKKAGIPSKNAASQIERIVNKENVAIKLNTKRTLDKWQTNCTHDPKWKEMHSSFLKKFEQLGYDTTPEAAKKLLSAYLHNYR